MPTTPRTALYLDPGLGADEMRAALYQGHLVMLSKLPSVATLAERADEQLRALFAPHDPDVAFEVIPPADMARLLGEWKPAFIHDPAVCRLVRQIIVGAGFDPEGTYYDVPKPRTSFPMGHLTTGIAFGFPWHRDTWYSAPAQQINWWFPVHPTRADNAMGFELADFARPVENSSEGFDYYRHNALRSGIAQQVEQEVIARPEAPEHQVIDQTVVLLPVGAILLFSGAHLHRSLPNTSRTARFSIDFRTVHLPDAVAGRGAPMVDVRCTGTSLRDFVRVADEADIDEALVRQIHGEPPAGAVLRFEAG